MEVHQLKYFCAIAKAGTFTRAAESMYVAQPSLSQQILKLEDELGGKLFYRLPREARLTPLGEVFLPRALAILQSIQQARAEIDNLVQSARSQAKTKTIAMPGTSINGAANNGEATDETMHSSLRKTA
jgi:LysR family transcriptional regulator, hydrogen peroxide-inducible genes activator